jgi:hypothetical protein
MLLIVIAAMGVALMVQEYRHARLLDELRKRPFSPFFKYTKQSFLAPAVQKK